MKDVLEKKTVKVIKVNVDKCIGCRACEVACSAFHATPQYSSTNPARARIRVIMDEFNDIYVPIYAGEYAKAECNGKNVYTVDGKTYDECTFCRASCPSRDYFKEPDSGLPLKCDMCLDEPPLEEPLCVQVCRSDSLTYEEMEEEEMEEEEKPGQLEIGLESLVNKHGSKRVMESLARMKEERE